MIDQYFDYKFGVLEYRSLRFEHETLDEEKIKFYIYDTQTIRHILHQQR